MRLGLPTIVFLLTIGSLGGAASDLTYALDAVLRGPDPIRTTGALAVLPLTRLGTQSPVAHLELDDVVTLANETFLKAASVKVSWQTTVDYGLGPGESPPVVAGPNLRDGQLTNLVLNLTAMDSAAQLLLVGLARTPNYDIRAAGTACDVRHAAPGEHPTFPSDPKAPGVAWNRAAESFPLVAECDVGAVQANSTMLFVYGVDLWLVDDVDPEGELIKTGTFRERDEYGLERTVTRIMTLEPGGDPYSIDLPHAGSLKLIAREFVNAGTVSVGAAVGNMTWGNSQTNGTVEPFEADGALTLRWSADSYIGIEGTTLNGPASQEAAGTFVATNPALAVGLVTVASAAIVAWLFWVLFSKIAPDRVLDHPRRVAILDYVRSEPGVETNTVCRSLGLHWMAAQHHIRTLQRAGHISLSRVGGRTALFAAKAGFRGQEIRVALMRREATRRLLGVLRESPGLDQAGLAARLGLSRQGVSKALVGLVGAGLVREVDGTPARRYFVADSPNPSSGTTGAAA